MSDLPVKVQPPTDKQPVVDIKTGNLTQYGQRFLWDMWKRVGGFEDGVFEARIAALIAATGIGDILNQFQDMQVELAELRTELAARRSYDDELEELRIQIASAQQISDNIIQQQESQRQELEAREELQIARQATITGVQYNNQWAQAQVIADTNQTIANLTTTSVPEGTRLYYTDARARAAISATGDVSYNNITGVISYSTPANSATATKLATPRNIAITGDIAWNVNFDGSANVTAAGTLATVNANVGSFGDASNVPTFTVNAKGLITAASSNAVVASAGTLSGTTLNATVVNSSLTSVGTLTSLAVTGTVTLSGGPALVINRAVGNNRLIRTQTSGVNRWDLILGDTTPEGGANAGSDVYLTCYTDAGAVLFNAFTVKRSTGVVTFPQNIAVGTYTATPGAITGYITIQDSGGTSRKIAVTT